MTENSDNMASDSSITTINKTVQEIERTCCDYLKPLSIWLPKFLNESTSAVSEELQITVTDIILKTILLYEKCNDSGQKSLINQLNVLWPLLTGAIEDPDPTAPEKIVHLLIGLYNCSLIYIDPTYLNSSPG